MLVQVLAFFAARAGAARVYSVEVDPLLAECLEQSVRENGFSDVIQVIPGDICSVPLRKPVDVFICEMIDTGLIDEMQVAAINSLRRRGIITSNTRMVPAAYNTSIEIGFTDFSYYGFQVLMPKHDWPHYSIHDGGWHPSLFYGYAPPQIIQQTDFHHAISNIVEVSFTTKALLSGAINAIRLSGSAYFPDGTQLGATNALNGDKVIAITPYAVTADQSIQVDVHYQMGAGLSSLQASVI